MQKLGLSLNLIGTILFGYGALDKSEPSWDDVAKQSDKALRAHQSAWFGVILIVIGFAIQIWVIK